MKKHLAPVRCLLFAMMAMMGNMALAQADCAEWQRLIGEGSYKSAYEKAEAVYRTGEDSGDLLAAAYYMSLAAMYYQEDAYDSAEARYRALLPRLKGVERALCHAFLNEYEEALEDGQLLRHTPVERVGQYVEGNKERNMTPTLYDVLVIRMQDRGDLEPQQRVEWQRRLVDFHRKDAEELRIWHDLRLLDLMAQVPNHGLGIDTIESYIAKYRGSTCGLYTRFYAIAASHCNGHEKYVEAVRFCDTAVALFPKSEGGVECSNLRTVIQELQISIESGNLTVAPGKAGLVRVRTRNVEHLWMRVVDYTEMHYGADKDRQRLLGMKAVAAWDVEVAHNAEYRYEESYVATQALPTGRYWLMVSPTADFKKKGFVMYEIDCTDMMLVQRGGCDGLLLDRSTGRPIAGQELRIENHRYNNPVQVLGKTTTDADGRYHFDIDEEQHLWSLRLVAERNGYRLETGVGYRMKQETESQLHCELRTDRPIYKPGDTVQVAVILFDSDGKEANVRAGEEVLLEWNDPNGKEIASCKVKSDEFGMASVAFAVPKDRMAGQYMVHVKNGERWLSSASVRVEEYKQPKFMVTLWPGARQEAGNPEPFTAKSPQFGVPYVVQGLAASYSAVPVGGAKVKYTVRRRQLNRWWWRYWGVEKEVEVGSGEATTAQDGSFSVCFTPEPDSSIDLSAKPCFEYLVSVDVTDINGESHPANLSVRVGFRNAFVGLKGTETECRDLGSLEVEHIDLNGNRLAGEVTMRVERLRQPKVPLLEPVARGKNVHHTLEEAAFRKAFPLYAYTDGYNDPSTWDTEEVMQGLPQSAPQGVYRITLSAEDADTVVEYRTVTPAGSRRPASQKLLWADVDKVSARVGEVVKVRVGSRFDKVDIYYQLCIGAQDVEFRHHVVDNEIKEIDIPITEEMLGGVGVTLVAVREGVVETWSKRIEVPYAHKELEISINTFRDRLMPGETEEWTLKVRGLRPSTTEPSAVLLAMYDGALDSYGATSGWQISPWRQNHSAAFSPMHIGGNSWGGLKTGSYRSYNGGYPNVWTLKDGLPWHGRWMRGAMYKSVAYNRVSAATVDAVEEEEEVFSVSDDAVAPMAATTSLAEVQTDEADNEGATGTDGGAAPNVRTNLNTLAFFAPDIRTDSNGEATFRFAVPELLTRWSIKGLAYTKSMRVGTMDRQLITQKPIMIQPNMPRFLRSGDSLALMAKVMNLTGAPTDAQVAFLLTDAATGDTICHSYEALRVEDNAQVMFNVEVPENVYVAEYTITVTTDAGSDGERDQMPVLGHRQAVTVSKALFINGAGEKHFPFPIEQFQSPTAEPRLIVAEVVSNPIWLAIKTMPYFRTLSNPSTLYLSDQLYVNSLGFKLLQGFQNIDSIGKLLESTAESRLHMNEEVKQTLLQSTPWVSEAESEEEQMRNVASYFNSASLQAALNESATQLLERQNADGGWGWMPEGKSSVWVTQRVLQRLATTQDAEQLVDQGSISRALHYIDAEQQHYYEQHIKPHLKKGRGCQPTNIDYLYTRSFFGKSTTEAYRYYYSNALKQYKDFEYIYSQAQLALVFHRHGDHKAASELIRRLKEKSLQSEEMGLYWRDNTSGLFWYQHPIETQALLIKAFAEISPSDTLTIGLMQQWLLKQKQTTHWGNDASTAAAISALAINTDIKPTIHRNSAQITLYNTQVSAPLQGAEGYVSQRWAGDSLATLIAQSRSTNGDIRLVQPNPSIAWGAIYYQYVDDMENIASNEMGITLRRAYGKRRADGSFAPMDAENLHVGDRVTVRIDISCDRTLEYLELVDGRPACAEPLSTRAGWQWSDGLSYYVTVDNSTTRCYIEHLWKGKYYMEYDIYITNPGHFTAAPVTIQSMYAPEFRALAPAQRLKVLSEP